MAIAMVCGVASCSDDDTTVPKNNISQETVTSTQLPGKVISPGGKTDNRYFHSPAPLFAFRNSVEKSSA